MLIVRTLFRLLLCIYSNVALFCFIDILHFLSVVDAFGHVSVRNPDNASQFILYVAPFCKSLSVLTTILGHSLLRRLS